MPSIDVYCCSLLRELGLGTLWDEESGPTEQALDFGEAPSPPLSTLQRAILRVALELHRSQDERVLALLGIPASAVGASGA